jgi:hypothetical protein
LIHRYSTYRYIEMSRQIGSFTIFRSTYEERETVDEAWINLALVQRQEIYAYKIGDCIDRQEILERWILSQRILAFVDFERDRLAYRARSLKGKTWREGYNSPSTPGLNSVPEDLKIENFKRQDMVPIRTRATIGRGGYN